jgi:hypothetical protein
MWIISTSVVFVLSKIVGIKRAHHIPVLGEIVAYPIYGLILHLGGIMDFRAFLVLTLLLEPYYLIATYVVGLVFWRASRMVGIID